MKYAPGHPATTPHAVTSPTTRLRWYLAPLLLLGGCFFTTITVEDGDQELLQHVEEIRQAQIALQVVDDFLPCSDEATAHKNAGPLRAWEGPACWTRIGWAPKSMVAGGYWVTVPDGAQDFQVYGTMDQDGDGTYLVVKASKDTPAAVISNAGVK
ncbi:MAG: hypothetical protein ACI9MC_002438 [Kiritimatiellia bacterium]|jgi:hypothetical protein